MKESRCPSCQCHDVCEKWPSGYLISVMETFRFNVDAHSLHVDGRFYFSGLRSCCGTQKHGWVHFFAFLRNFPWYQHRSAQLRLFGRFRLLLKWEFGLECLWNKSPAVLLIFIFRTAIFGVSNLIWFSSSSVIDHVCEDRLNGLIPAFLIIQHPEAS